MTTDEIELIKQQFWRPAPDKNQMTRDEKTPAENAALRMAKAQYYLQSWELANAPSNPEDLAKSFLERAREQEKYNRAERDLTEAIRAEIGALLTNPPETKP